MSKLTEYIEELKDKINSKGDMSEIDIIRYVYINLGQKMNFDLKYTFGNRDDRNRIYNKMVDDEELEHVFETHTIICKSLAYLLQRILKEFDIDVKVVKEEPVYGEKRSRHIFNTVTLKNGKTYNLDLEDDLQYIQFGAKTRNFGISVCDDEFDMVTDKQLKDIDINKSDYIPEGYYFEDMIWMLKLAIDRDNIGLDKKMEFVLENIEKYRDTKSVTYRERFNYHKRVLEELFTGVDARKIHLIDCYKKVNEEKVFQSLIFINMPKNQQKLYMYSVNDYKYEEISMEELAQMVKNGLQTLEGVPGLRTFLKSEGLEGR